MEEVIIAEAVMDVPNGNEDVHHGDRPGRTSSVSDEMGLYSYTSEVTHDTTCASDESAFNSSISDIANDNTCRSEDSELNNSTSDITHDNTCRSDDSGFNSSACERTHDTCFSILAHDYVKVTELLKGSQKPDELSLETHTVSRIECSQPQTSRTLSENITKQLLDIRSNRSAAVQFINVSSANRHIPTSLCEQNDRQAMDSCFRELRDRQVINTTSIHGWRDRHVQDTISLHEQRDMYVHNTTCLRERRDRQGQNTTGQLLIARHLAEARTHRSVSSHNQRPRDINNNHTEPSQVSGCRSQPLFKLQDCFQGQGLLSLAACVTYTLLLMFIFCVCGLLLDSIKSAIGAQNLQGIRANLIQSRRPRSTMASG